MTSSEDKVKQQWNGDLNALGHGIEALAAGIDKVGKPLFLVDNNGQTSVAHEGNLRWCDDPNPKDESLPLLGFVPPLSPTRLGEASFKEDLGLKYAYIVGAMANGITSVEMVLAAGQAGMVGFFGAGGLSLEQIKTAIDHLKPHQDKIPVGFNLIHSPSDMVLEMKTVELYLQHGIHLVSASAYLGLTLPLVLYRVKGIHRRGDGTVVCPNHVVAKVSREEVAAKFFAPPPNKLLTQLVNDRLITPEEAELAQEIPMAQDITAEADSGGHTDNRPALSLLPTFLTLKESAMAQYRFAAPLRVGLGGGIATPDAAAAGFAMGAAYVLTGSINQAAVEADTSERVRGMLV